MFNIGISEIVIILSVILLLFKPNDFRKVARTIGKMMGTFKNYKNALLHEIDLSAQLSESAENKTNSSKESNKEEKKNL